MSEGLEKVTLKKKWGKWTPGAVIDVDPKRLENLVDRGIAVAGVVKTSKKRKEGNDA
ncbi:hypothetical protein LCGC14_3086820 [marine sediment metagenome]|uniref:Uncharacterized protein n=1 Tax=marine sediment metagenome TaxID=412755 RepID=A0A0F8X0A5_9ZZZZ